jgi:hypothetical protein
MTSSGETAGSAEQRLRELIARGFKFLHPRDATGQITAVIGVRPHHDVIDVVHLRNEDDAVAMRLPGDETDVFLPARFSWRSHGPACRVLDDLLGLPDVPHSDETAGTGRNGYWVHVKQDRAKWLPVTA